MTLCWTKPYTKLTIVPYPRTNLNRKAYARLTEVKNASHAPTP